MVAVMLNEPQRGVRGHGRLIDSRDLNVGVSRALPSRPVPERGHHRCCQPAPTMIRTGPDRCEPQPISAAMAAGNRDKLGMIIRCSPATAAKARGGLPSKIIRTILGSAEFGRLR